jgi:hypothetical protein
MKSVRKSSFSEVGSGIVARRMDRLMTRARWFEVRKTTLILQAAPNHPQAIPGEIVLA